MDLYSACNQLSEWITASAGEPILIAPDVLVSFRRGRTYSEDEINRSAWSAALPESYRHFLKEIGSAELFIDQYGLGIIFHPLEAIQKYQSAVFTGRRDPFPSLILVASLTNRGDEAGFDMRSSYANFAVFSHEDDPEEWSDAHSIYVGFSDWLTELVASNGEADLPHHIAEL